LHFIKRNNEEKPMTADDTEPRGGDAKQRLDILLADYQACREDERVQFATVAAVIGVLVTLIGLMAAAVTQTCEFSSSKTCIAAPDYLLAISPMIPIALLAYAIYILVVGTLRTYYMRGLENEIRNHIWSPIASLGDLMPASYMGIVQEVTSLRRGRVAYRLIAALMFVSVILIFGGYTTYAAFHVKPSYQIAMAVAYGGIAILFVWQVTQASMGGRTFFKRAAEDFLNNKPLLPTVSAPGDSSVPRQGRPLVYYLIFPRPEDWIKWLIAPGVFLVVAWAFNELSRWRVFIELWLILEYLIYEARYQWNDARGVDEDAFHSEHQARRRLPGGPADRTRRNVLISLAVASARLVVALAVGEALGLLRPVLVLMALVLSIAIVYETLRSQRPSSTALHPTPTVVAIWCIVGLGYGVRAGLGLIAGGLSVMNPLTWIGISCFVLFGVMFVLLTWVLEAASCCYCGEGDGIWRAKARVPLKPHLMGLLRYVPIDLGEQVNAAYSAKEDGSRRAILGKRGRVRTPWNLALVVSAALGGALGAGLAQAAHSYPSGAIAVSLSLVAAGLLACCKSQHARFVISGMAAVVLAGTISPFTHWPYGLFAAGPWLAIAFSYSVFRGSSYRDLKEFGPNLLEAISSVRIVLKVAPSLLHVVIGDRAWLAAGFASSSQDSEASDVTMGPHAATIVASADGPESIASAVNPQKEEHCFPLDT
jgi:hypothetical protein